MPAVLRARALDPPSSPSSPRMRARTQIVGGIAEMYLQHPSKEVLMLKDRKGFVRVAVEEGVSGGIVSTCGASPAAEGFSRALHVPNALCRWARVMTHGPRPVPFTVTVLTRMPRPYRAHACVCAHTLAVLYRAHAHES